MPYQSRSAGPWVDGDEVDAADVNRWEANQRAALEWRDVRATSVSGLVAIDADVAASNLDYTLTGNATFQEPTGGANHQVLQLVAVSSGVTRTAAFAIGYRLLPGVQPTYLIAPGEALRAALRRSTLAGVWFVEAAGVA